MLFYPIDARIRYIMSTIESCPKTSNILNVLNTIIVSTVYHSKIVPTLNISIECWFVFFILGKAMILPIVASCYTTNIEQIPGFTNLPLIQHKNLGDRIPRVTYNNCHVNNQCYSHGITYSRCFVDSFDRYLHIKNSNISNTLLPYQWHQLLLNGIILNM